MDNKPQRPAAVAARQPIAGLGLHDENAVSVLPTGKLAGKPVRPDSRRALANVSNSGRAVVPDVSSTGPLKPRAHAASALAPPVAKNASALSSSASTAGTSTARAPLRPKQSAGPAAGVAKPAPRQTASTSNLAASFKSGASTSSARQTHTIYADESESDRLETDPAVLAERTVSAGGLSDRSAAVSDKTDTSVSSVEKLEPAAPAAKRPTHIAQVYRDPEPEPARIQVEDDVGWDDAETEADEDEDVDVSDFININPSEPGSSSEHVPLSARAEQPDARLVSRPASEIASNLGSSAQVSVEVVPTDVHINARVLRELDAAQQWAIDTQDEELEDLCDYSMASEYRDEIFGYMRKLEERMRPNGQYMDRQTEIEWPMRAVLVDWLVQVHYRFSLLPETLFLAINIIDRFLSVKVVSVGKLQLVGATAILVAAKYEEISCPSLSDMVYMVDNGYPADEILKAERFMLTMLQFELGWPGPMSFLRRISKADDYDWETRTLAKYFLEIAIMEQRFVGVRPSVVAAAAHCLSRFMLSKGDWTIAHVYYSQYTYEQIRPLVVTLVECCNRPRRHHAAVYDKYAHSRFSRASHFVETEIREGFVVPPVCASNLSSPSDSPSATSVPSLSIDVGSAGVSSESVNRQTENRSDCQTTPSVASSASVVATPTDENAPPPSAASTTSLQSCFSAVNVDGFGYGDLAESDLAGEPDRKRRR